MGEASPCNMSSINLDLVCYEHSDFPLNSNTEGLILCKRVELFERFSLVNHQSSDMFKSSPIMASFAGRRHQLVKTWYVRFSLMLAFWQFHAVFIYNVFYRVIKYTLHTWSTLYIYIEIYFYNALYAEISVSLLLLWQEGLDSILTAFFLY